MLPSLAYAVPAIYWAHTQLQDRQYTYNIIWMCIHATIAAVEKQKVLRILSVYLS